MAEGPWTEYQTKPTDAEASGPWTEYQAKKPATANKFEVVTPDRDVPFQTPPGAVRGTVLPFMKDPSGNISLAMPELLAAPIRGAVKGGQAILGERPGMSLAGDPDVLAATGVGVGGLPKVSAAGERAAPVIRSAAAKAAPSTRPVPEGFMPYEEASKIALQVQAERTPASTIRGVQRTRNAAATIAARANADAPTTAQAVIDRLTTARGAGKPMMLPDVLDANVESLAGRVARTPGAAKEAVRSALKERAAGSVTRLSGDIDKALGEGNTVKLFDELKTARSQAAKPLFDKAYEGGSMAPLERQFEAAFNEASAAEQQASRDLTVARSQLTAARGKQTQTSGNVYSESAASAGNREAQVAVTKAERALAAANEQKQQVLDTLHQAQSDRMTGVKGAVWNPRIQEFLGNPRVKQGIQRGWRIERDEALSEGRPINPTDYAIVGWEDGEPVVGKVPTMRLLAVAKEGLDRMLQSSEFRNELTGELNKEGVAIDKLRNAFVSELDRVNPDYAAAREVWAGDSKSMDALRWGQKALSDDPRTVAKRVGEMTPGEKEFARIGLAQGLRDIANKRGPLAAEFDRIAGTRYGSQWARDQIAPFFDNPSDLQRFIDSVTAETEMARTGNRILGGSQTAERLAEDQAPITPKDIAHLGISGVLGHGATFLNRGIDIAGRFMAPLRRRQESEIARVLMDPNTRLELGNDGKLRVVPKMPDAIIMPHSNPFPPGPGAP
ncbi:MAG TPA: hypothetical protein VF835_01075 [Rhizomicrobium sp.]